MVRFAVEQRIEGRQPDYWDHASLLELAVVEGDSEQARTLIPRLKAAVREGWEIASTADNLELIGRAHEQRGFGAKWLRDTIAELRRE